MKKTALIILFALTALCMASIASASMMWTTTAVKPVITLRYTNSLGRNVLQTFTLPGYFEMVQDNNYNLYIRILALSNDRTYQIAGEALGTGVLQPGGGISAVLCAQDQLQPDYIFTLGNNVTMTTPVDALIMTGTYNVNAYNQASGTITMTAAGFLDAGGNQTPARMTATYHLPAMPLQTATGFPDSMGRDFTPPAASPIPPTATDMHASIAFGSTTTINLTNGAQSFQTDGALTAFIDSQPVNGTLSSVAGGKYVTYTPTAGFSGNDAFTYHVTDSALQNSLTTYQVTITVGAKPAASSILLKVEKNTPSPGTKIDFSSLNLGNVTVTGVTPVAGSPGTVTQIGSVFYYLPATGFTGFDTLNYTLSGGLGTGIVNVEVCPIAVDVFQALNGNSATVNVLSSDIPFNSSDTLSFVPTSTISQPVSQPEFGSAVVNTSTGQIVYTLNGAIPAGVTEDHFLYTIQENINGVLQTSTGVVTILLQ